MERNDVLNMRLPADLKTALKLAAADDRRTMSGLVEVILGDWLTEKGYLKARSAKAKKRG